MSSDGQGLGIGFSDGVFTRTMGLSDYIVLAILAVSVWPPRVCGLARAGTARPMKIPSALRSIIITIWEQGDAWGYRW